jgi:hypothetical protein
VNLLYQFLASSNPTSRDEEFVVQRSVSVDLEMYIPVLMKVRSDVSPETSSTFMKGHSERFKRLGSNDASTAPSSSIRNSPALSRMGSQKYVMDSRDSPMLKLDTPDTKLLEPAWVLEES